MNCPKWLFSACLCDCAVRLRSPSCTVAANRFWPSVLMIPSATAFTRIPRFAYSIANDLVAAGGGRSKNQYIRSRQRGRSREHIYLYTNDLQEILRVWDDIG